MWSGSTGTTINWVYWCVRGPTTQWTRMLKGTQNSSENATTEPTMLSARNFPNVLMSSLSMKSHRRSTTSWTCFIHFPCRDHQHPNIYSFVFVFQTAGDSKSWRNSPLRHRSPQCRVCLCAGTGSGLCCPGRGRRRRCCSDSRLYTTSWFLQRRTKQIQTLHCS